MDSVAHAALRAALARAAHRLQEHLVVYEKNETAVREQIILPILRSLGWDTESPKEVHPEDRSDVGSPDYTLRSDGRSVVTIEVKKRAVDVALPGALEQAHRYASAKGVGLCLATNGESWVLARSFEEGRDLRGRILWQALLSEGTIDDVAKKLSFVARANVANIDEFVQLQDRIATEWDQLLDEPAPLVASLVGLLNERIGKASERLPYAGFIEDYVSQRVREMTDGTQDAGTTEVFEPESGSSSTGVTGIGSGFRRGTVASILLDAAERALKEGRLLSNDTIETGHTRFLVSARPIHKNGRQFLSPRRLSNGLYIETHSSVANAMRHADLLNAHRKKQ